MEHSSPAMSGYSTTSFLPGAGTRCPGCSERGLQAVFNDWETNFLCRSCKRCWRFDLGFVSEVRPSACPGCNQRSVCLAQNRCVGGASSWWG